MVFVSLWFNSAMLKRCIILCVMLFTFTIGCNTNTPSPEPTSTTPPTSIWTKTPTPSQTLTPTHTSTPTVTPTPTWVWHPPGEVVAPILLYHHVAVDETSVAYNVKPSQFAEQMAALDEWGYTAITAKTLIRVIKNGGDLPPRPVVITFDDGNLDVYENAFPIMQEYGFPGVTYVVANRLKADGFTGVAELTEMLDAGWEVGSHSTTHVDISKDTSLIPYEIKGSRDILEKALPTHIRTFAYPFGAFTQSLGEAVYRYEFLGGMGLGNGSTHSENSLFYMKRIEIKGGYDLETFASLLPWSEPPEE